MKQQFKQLLLTVLVALCSLTASAYNFELDRIYYNIISRENLTCEVTYKDYYYNSYRGDVEIPSSVTHNGQTYAVTKIGEKAFRDCSNLTFITIPNSVTQIGENAFYGCTKLASVIMSENLTTISDNVFDGCKSLPVEDNIRYAGTYLIEPVDKSLKTYTIKEGTRYIGTKAFNGSKELTSIVIPNGATTIFSEAFQGCSSLKSVIIPDGVTVIGYSAFRDCSNLKSVIIPGGVTVIDNTVFYKCSSLTSVTIPDGVTSIGYSAFYGCI